MEDREPLAYTIPEFCRSAKMSVRQFYVLDKRGEAPPTARYGPKMRRVLRETGKQWLKECEEADA